MIMVLYSYRFGILVLVRFLVSDCSFFFLEIKSFINRLLISRVLFFYVGVLIFMFDILDRLFILYTI